MPSPNWTFLDTFRRPSPGQVNTWKFLDIWNAKSLREARSSAWPTIGEWARLLRAIVDDLTTTTKLQLIEWHAALEPLGGDPAEYVWSDFRPLRTSREEDWSDWLQHLLATSKTGTFARELHQGILPANSDFTSSTVLRETSSNEGERRADLVIFWRSGIATHIEVKVGDQSFEKTFETSRLLSRDFPEVREWKHLILLPSADRPAWLECRNDYGKGGPDVFDLSWERVAIGLRSSLLTGGETLSWQTWAWTFCGAVEQRLLGIPPLGNGLAPVDAHLGPQLASFLEILKKARKAESCRNP